VRQWTVDAFASAPFRGNPACVVEPFDQWPDDGWMQALAKENNQAETAFLLRGEDPARFGLRWFTPGREVDLCGHATLGSAHVLMAELGATAAALTFDTRSGPLTVRRAGDGYEMDFPADMPRRTGPVAGLAEALGAEPAEVWAARYLVAVLADADAVRTLRPNIAALASLQGEAGEPGEVIVCADAEPADTVDVIDRFFAPGCGVDEDPATGLGPLHPRPALRRAAGAARCPVPAGVPGPGRRHPDRPARRSGAASRSGRDRHRKPAAPHIGKGRRPCGRRPSDLPGRKGQALPATIVAIAALDADLHGQPVVAAVEIVALPAGQAAAQVAALQADQAVEFRLQAGRLAAAQRAVAQADVDAAVELEFAVADRLPAAAVLLVTVATIMAVVVLGDGGNRDGRRGDGQHGDEGFLHHRSYSFAFDAAGLAALKRRKAPSV
jgi:PhzF family phenazine biosynthesis protein